MKYEGTDRCILVGGEYGELCLCVRPGPCFGATGEVGVAEHCGLKALFLTNQ